MKQACWIAVLMLCLFAKANAQNLFVINYGSSYPYDYTIEKFNSNGVGQVFATASSGNFFTCLAFDSSGYLYVGQGGAGGGTILKFNSSGGGTVFANTGLVASPSGLAFDNNGNLYVANLNNSIQKFNTNGVGTLFANTGLNLEGPTTGMAFDNSGNLYVANYNGNNIDKFNSGGSGSVFASSGLNGPIGLAFDNNTNLYVSNWGTTTINRFSSTGSGSIFVNSGPPFGSLDGPMGLAFDKHGNLYVANYQNNTIEAINSNGVGMVFASNIGLPIGTTVLNNPIALAFQPSPPAPTNLTITATSGGFNLTFSTISNDLYDVQATTTLVSAVWSTLISNIVGNGGTTNYIDAVANIPQKFYRVYVHF